MAILRNVKAVMSTLLEISSIHEIPEAKKYLIMTLVEMITTWKAKKMDARMALIKWMTLKIFIIFIRPEFSPSQGLLSKIFSLSSSLYAGSGIIDKIEAVDKMGASILEDSEWQGF
jgi:hypothetical protein